MTVKRIVQTLAALGLLAGVPAALSAREDSGTAPPAGGGWLGVQLDEVPPPLAAQLGTNENGVLVINLVKSSPAEKAGLERYDVITEVDGQKLAAGDIRGLSDKVGAKKAGESLKLTVMRSGQQRQLTVTLGERPADERWDWRYEYTPESMVRERVRQRGHVLQRGPNGEWEFHDLQGPDFLKNLPDDIQKLLPRGDGMSTRIYVDNDRKMVTARADRDGNTIEVTQKDDGPITVRRNTAGESDDKAQEKTYNTEDDLQSGDAEAYEIFKDAQQSHSFSIDRNGRTFTFGFNGWDAQSRQWREELQRQMEEARRSLDEAMKQFHGAPGLWFNTPGGHFRMFGAPLGEDENDENGPGIGIDDSKPKQTFRVNPDGQIECHLRKGQSEVIKVYRDEQDLKTRAPDLYNAYKQANP
ncbi:MAG TPA: PDZ domain-containing protein [Phycisphaerae bacterium]|jgi:hypothetical protein